MSFRSQFFNVRFVAPIHYTLSSRRASTRLFIYTLCHILDIKMRILVLSDLHSNATALDAVLTAAKDRWDLSVCLGDVVGYGPDPNEVTARLRELGTQTIRGNHDKAVTGLMPTEDFNPVAKPP